MFIVSFKFTVNYVIYIMTIKQADIISSFSGCLKYCHVVIKYKKQLVINNMDLNEHERLSTLHLDTN